MNIFNKKPMVPAVDHLARARARLAQNQLTREATIRGFLEGPRRAATTAPRRTSAAPWRSSCGIARIADPNSFWMISVKNHQRRLSFTGRRHFSFTPLP